MFKRDGVYQTKNIGKGTNTMKYIILHHTGAVGGGNLKILLGQTDRVVSAHFLITQKGEAFKLAEPTQITYHAGTSKWGDINGMNGHSIGIEIEGPGFTDIQFKKVCEVVKYLSNGLKIPKENILKHSDITQEDNRTSQKKLWDGISKSRKTDLSPEFRKSRGYKNFTEFRTICL